MARIFISYRRQDSDAYSGRLYDRLSARFGKAWIFMDIDMDLGVDFVDEIEQRVASCDALIAVIGRSWMDVKDDCLLPQTCHVRCRN
jgi:TIR domain